jgi:hypothetical protein
MAITSVRAVSELEDLFVFAPERYDPRRESLPASPASCVPLRKLVATVRRTVTGVGEPSRHCLVFDTSDAREGIVVLRKEPMLVGDLGSAKKVIEPNDVVISRLRPYLRQVAFVDASVRDRFEGRVLLCSTEFFVLRQVDEESIAFLVPFLLSAPVQKVLTASQEGGHHPRFNEATLLGLPVPRSFIEDRKSISKAVEQSVRLFRESETSMTYLVEKAEAALGGRNASFSDGIIDNARSS